MSNIRPPCYGRMRVCRGYVKHGTPDANSHPSFLILAISDCMLHLARGSCCLYTYDFNHQRIIQYDPGNLSIFPEPPAACCRMHYVRGKRNLSAVRFLIVLRDSEGAILILYHLSVAAPGSGRGGVFAGRFHLPQSDCRSGSGSQSFPCQGPGPSHFLAGGNSMGWSGGY